MERVNSADFLPVSKTQTQQKKIFNFFTLKNGSKISCHGRPKESDIKRLKNEYKVNYILTILHENENPQAIQNMLKKWEIFIGITFH